MTILTPRAKRGRRKTIPRALVRMEHDPTIINIEEENGISTDENSKLSACDLVLDGYGGVAV